MNLDVSISAAWIRFLSWLSRLTPNYPQKHALFWIVSMTGCSDTFSQAILAGAFTKKDYSKAATTASRVLQVCWFLKLLFIWLFAFCIANGSIMQLGLVLGLSLSVILVVVLQFAPRIFTQDIDVLQLMGLSIPVFLLSSDHMNVLFQLTWWIP